MAFASVSGTIFEDDSPDIGLTVVITVKFLHGDTLRRIPFLHLVRSCADRILVEITGCKIFALQQMLWQNADGHVVRKCHVDLFQLDLDRQVVGTGDLVDIRIIGDDFRLVVFIQDGLQRKFHVGRSQRLSIVEGQPLPEA